MNLGRCIHKILGYHGIVAVCALPMSLFGIRGYGATSERWFVADCGFYTIVTDAGTVSRMTREEPQRGYFNHDHTLCRGKSKCVAG